MTAHPTARPDAAGAVRPNAAGEARPSPAGEAPLVSIVITVYNEDPRFLTEAIESARAQTHQPIEILVVEDGALRDYRPLLDGYPELKVLRQTNQGLSAARNTGLAAARGDFILFLDGDDRLLPRAIAQNLGRFRETPEALMVYGSYQMIDSEGRISAQVRMPPLGADPYATMLEGNCIGMHAAVLYRREPLLALGGFDPAYRALEDYELYLRVARAGGIVAGSEVIAEYRQHGHNMSRDRAMMLTKALQVLRAQEEPVRANPVWRRARSMGRKGWKSFYARGQWAEVLESLADRSRLARSIGGLARSIGGLARSIGGLARLALVIPFTLGKEALMEILKRWRARSRFGAVDFGDLRRTSPISRHFGYDRGLPVDRRYIEDFLTRHGTDIRGRVLEVGDNAYTLRFGGAAVDCSEVLHVDPEAPNVTYCTDLTRGEGIPDDTFDCIVLTQTLHLIFDLAQAVQTLHRVLKPGGVLLVTVPGVSSIDAGEWGDTWFWSFTPASLRTLMERQFGQAQVEIGCFGNVLVATSFLYGLAESELRPREFHVHDPQYPVIVTARVTKGVHGGAREAHE